MWACGKGHLDDGEKHAIPLSSMNRAINRYRTRRLYRRMLAQLERLVPIEGQG